MTITIKDETFAGTVLHEMDLEFASDIATIKEIITCRVEKEVQRFNKAQTPYFRGLVEPSEAEKTLNGYKLKPSVVIDAEKQVFVALAAFQKNGYFVLIDNIQSESLEQEIVLHRNTVVSFVKLTPLVGG